VAVDVKEDHNNDKWGTLRGRFVYDGKIPDRKKLLRPVGVDGDLFDDSLLIDAENNGIENIVIWLWTKDTPEIAIHPGYVKARETPVQISVDSKRIEPHTTIVRTEQPVEISNMMEE